MKEEILRLDNLSYDDSVESILKNINIKLFKGEILGIVGMNGSGKSTVAKILAGVKRPYLGHILLNGRRVEYSTPYEAMNLGIGYISEEPNLLYNMTVAENLFVGLEGKWTRYIDYRKLNMDAEAIFKKYNFDVNPNELAGNLKYGQQKLVEIARVLAKKPSILIIDDIMSSLSSKEIDNFIAKIVDINRKGISIIFFSHEPNEVIPISDRIITIREGMCVNIESKKPFNVNAIKRSMLKEYQQVFESKTQESHKKSLIGEEALRVEHLSTNLLRDISFSLSKGEILGFTGLVGSGRSELMNCIYGINNDYSGRIYIKGKKVTINKPIDAIRNSIGYSMRERKEHSLISKLSIKHNISLCSLDRISNKYILRPKMERLLVQSLVDNFNIKADINVKVELLSSSEQDKVSIAKSMSTNPEILILDEPTSGIDESGKREIAKLIMNIKKYCSIIIVSTNVNEVVHLLDRLIIMDKGRIIRQLDKEDIILDQSLKDIEEGGNL